MTFDPFSTNPTATLSEAQSACAVYSVLEWLTSAPLAETTRDDYRRNVKRLKTLPSTSHKVFTLDWIKVRTILRSMPFDPANFKSVKAQDKWCAKVVAAFKGASGEIEAGRERRARDDDWSALIGRVTV